eukprot:149522-Chlamydomonas_euryale.AAC.1
MQLWNSGWKAAVWTMDHSASSIRSTMARASTHVGCVERWEGVGSPPSPTIAAICGTWPRARPYPAAQSRQSVDSSGGQWELSTRYAKCG